MRPGVVAGVEWFIIGLWIAALASIAAAFARDLMDAVNRAMGY